MALCDFSMYANTNCKSPMRQTSKTVALHCHWREGLRVDLPAWWVEVLRGT